MRTRFLVVGTLVGALVMFAWQSVSNALIPWHTSTMREFAGDSATARAIRAAAPTNGVYFSKYGVLAAVAITPDFADRTAGAAIGPMLGRQVVLDLVATLVAVLLVLRLPAEGALRTGTTLALAALAVAGVLQLSDWNWYGFGASYALVNVIDQTFSFFLVGETLGALRRRGTATVGSDERAGVRAQGGLPTSG